ASLWRTRCAEAEAQLLALRGGSDGTPEIDIFAWGQGDEKRFRRDLDDKVVSLVDQNQVLRERVAVLEEKLESQAKDEEKRQISAANRAQFETKKIVEDALLRRVHEEQNKVAEKEAALQESMAMVEGLASRNEELEDTATNFHRQLGEAKGRLDRDAEEHSTQLSQLQKQVEELSAERDTAVKASSSEVEAMGLRLATALKDYTVLYEKAGNYLSEADDLKEKVMCLTEDAQRASQAAESEREKASATLQGLEERLQHQEAETLQLSEELMGLRAVERQLRATEVELQAVVTELRAAVAGKEENLMAVRTQLLESQEEGRKGAEALAEARSQFLKVEEMMGLVSLELEGVKGERDAVQEVMAQREMELEELMGRLVEARAEGERLTSELEEARALNVEGQDKLAAQEDQALSASIAHEATIAALRREASASKAELSALSEALSLAETHRSEFMFKVEGLEAALLEANKSQEKLEKRAAAAEGQATSMLEEVSSLRGKMSRDEQRFQEERAGLEATALVRESELAASRARALVLGREVASKDVEKAKLVEELGFLEKSLAAAEGEVESRKAELAAKDVEKSELAEELVSLEKRLAAAEGKIKSREKELMAKDAEKLELKDELESLEKRMAVTEGEVKSREEELMAKDA
ncbi:unnamed protein product, partial [Discosporangium mesarthrocarpum]